MAFLGNPWLILFAATTVIFLLHRLVVSSRPSVAVPVVGRQGIIGSWINSFLWTWEARDWIQKGYNKHGDYAFQVSTPNGWEVCICDGEMIKEYKNLMDDQMSALAITSETFQSRFTLPGGDWNAIHDLPPQPALARSLMWLKSRAANENDPYFMELAATFRKAFDTEISVPSPGSNTFPCFPKYCRIVAAMTVKALLGSMAGDPGVIDLLVKYAEAVPVDGFFIAAFPNVLRPLVARFSAAPKLSEKLIALVMEEVTQRNVRGDHSKPQDMTDWMVDWLSKNPGYLLRGAVARVIATFFGGIHTTTQLIVHSLFEISTRLEYVEPLRQEIKEALATHGGWNKAAIESMPKIDSFIKETQRFNPLDAASLARQATCDFRFSNGLELPKGTWVFAPNGPMVVDDRLYTNAHQFDGFRFWRLGQQTQKPQDYRLVATNQAYLQFGDGRHTCPGRFMAADETRLILAYTLWNYDIAIKDHGPRPTNNTFKKICFPDMSAEIMLTTRSDTFLKY